MDNHNDNLFEEERPETFGALSQAESDSGSAIVLSEEDIRRNKKLKRGHRMRILKENLLGWSIVGPILLYFGIFTLIPLVMVIRFSLMSDPKGLLELPTFTGLSNYIKIFTNLEYYRLFGATLLIAVSTIVISLVLGMLFAILMSQPIRGKTFYRTVYYMPVVISMAVIAMIANVWLDYNNGMFTNLFKGFGWTPIHFQKYTAWMFFWIIAICTWKGLGATIILFIAGLAAISPEIYEAAELDGATPWTKFWHITLPLMRSIIVFVVITSIINAFNVFEPVELISGGGPSGTTQVILFKIYNEAFQNANWGLGSAVSVVVLIILMVLSIFTMRFDDAKD